jgi:hypothetical protein
MTNLSSDELSSFYCIFTQNFEYKVTDSLSKEIGQNQIQHSSFRSLAAIRVNESFAARNFASGAIM